MLGMASWPSARAVRVFLTTEPALWPLVLCFLFLTFTPLIHLVHAYTPRLEGSLRELVSSSTVWDWGLELRWAGLAAAVLTRGAISPAGAVFLTEEGQTAIGLQPRHCRGRYTDELLCQHVCVVFHDPGHLRKC